MKRRRLDAWASGPGVAVCVLLLALGGLLAACAPGEPSTPEGPRTWDGPGAAVASSGVVTYERREIAQRVPLPACVSVGGDRYRFAEVTSFPGGGITPPGLTDTFYRLDRWRLWTRPGALEGQPSIFVTVRGSSGIVAEYARIGPGEPCDV